MSPGEVPACCHLSGIQEARETSGMRTVLLTSSVVVAGFAEALSTHSCYGTS